MKRVIGAVVLLLAITATARAHFLFIVPPARFADRTLTVVFSDTTEPDKNPKLLDKIAHTKFQVIDGRGRAKAIKAVRGRNALLMEVGGKEPVDVVGVCDYGVISKGKESFRLFYYGRTCLGGGLTEPLPATVLPLQVVLADTKAGVRVQVLWQGRPLAGSEVVAVWGEKSEPVKTDRNGIAQLKAAEAGPVAVRASYVETKKGKHDGKEYSSVRHYATLVIPSR
jgi:hypothetical protein